MSYFKDSTLNEIVTETSLATGYDEDVVAEIVRMYYCGVRDHVNNLRNVRCMGLGVFYRSPISEKIIEKYGIESYVENIAERRKRVRAENAEKRKRRKDQKDISGLEECNLEEARDREDGEGAC